MAGVPKQRQVQSAMLSQDQMNRHEHDRTCLLSHVLLRKQGPVHHHPHIAARQPSLTATHNACPHLRHAGQARRSLQALQLA